MRDWNIELRCNQGGGHRRVDIAHDEDEIGPARPKHRLKPKHDPSGLLGAGARSNFKIDVSARDVQLLEEHGIHGDIIVLPRVDEADRESVLLAKRTGNWRNFHEVLSCADKVIDMPRPRFRRTFYVVDVRSGGRS